MNMEIAEYKQLIIGLRPSLLQVAYRMLNNKQDAEDAVQEVCLRIWHHRDTIGQQQSIEAYSVAMTKNVCIDRIRVYRPTVDETVLETKTDVYQTPHQILEESDNHQIIRRIIDTLPPLQKRILQLKDVEGYETDEIMKMYDMTAEAVRINLSRARKRVREMYLAFHNAEKKDNNGRYY